MNKLIHVCVLIFWAYMAQYAINELETSYDSLMCIVLFLCGVCAASQICVLVSDIEETM